MVEGSQRFRVDLDELEQIMARISGFTGFLSDSLEGLRVRNEQAQQNWNGASADAQADAFRSWMSGAAGVADGIAAMRAAAEAARDRYNEAAAVNRRMLGRG